MGLPCKSAFSVSLKDSAVTRIHPAVVPFSMHSVSAWTYCRILRLGISIGTSNGPALHSLFFLAVPVADRDFEFSFASLLAGCYNFPLCAVDREFWPICAKSITGYKVRFPESCGICAVRDACGGLFTGSYRLAKGDVTPIGDKIEC